jgi:hypothetical protein
VISNHDIIIELGGHEIVCNVDLTPYDPGQTSGPPERCYPPEGGDVDINSIRLRIKPGKTPDCFLDIEDLVADLDGLDRVASLVDDEVEKLLKETSESPEPYYGDTWYDSENI